MDIIELMMSDSDEGVLAGAMKIYPAFGLELAKVANDGMVMVNEASKENFRVTGPRVQ